MDEREYDIFLSRYYATLYGMVGNNKKIVIDYFSYSYRGDCFLYNVIKRIGVLNNQEVYVRPWRLISKLRMLWNKEINRKDIVRKIPEDAIVISDSDVCEILTEAYKEYNHYRIMEMQKYILTNFYGIEGFDGH